MTNIQDLRKGDIIFWNDEKVTLSDIKWDESHKQYIVVYAKDDKYYGFVCSSETYINRVFTDPLNLKIFMGILLPKFGIHHSYIFGSYGTAEFHNESDINICINFEHIDKDIPEKVYCIKEILSEAVNRSLNLVVCPSQSFLDRNKSTLVKVF